MELIFLYFEFFNAYLIILPLYYDIRLTNHSFSQLLSNSHLHDQVASEIDYLNSYHIQIILKNKKEIHIYSARFLMGIGDATAPLVLYTAPPNKTSLCLSIFLASIPLGYSLGYFVSSELLYSLPSFNIIAESWQRLFCWETVFLLPIIIYSWWTIRGPDSLIAMANYNIKTHSLYDIITNQLYLGIVFGHTLQGFGCCVLTIIVWNKLNNWGDFLGNGKGFKLDAYELWSLIIFIFGTFGIICGGLLVDYVHNKSVFCAKKRRKKKIINC